MTSVHIGRICKIICNILLLHLLLMLVLLLLLLLLLLLFGHWDHSCILSLVHLKTTFFIGAHSVDRAWVGPIRICGMLVGKFSRRLLSLLVVKQIGTNRSKSVIERLSQNGIELVLITTTLAPG